MTKKKSTSSTASCANCHRVAELHTGVRANKFYENLCDRCIGVLGSSEFYRRADRQSQRRTYAADILQPGDPEFARVYGADKARQHGWSDEQIRRNT